MSSARIRRLKLERDSVLFLAVTWTAVHIITEESPLWKKTADDLERLQAECLILIKGVDDTFSQTVHARYSYRYDEMLRGARFAPAFHVDANGDLELDVGRVSDVMGSPAAPKLTGGRRLGGFWFGSGGCRQQVRAIAFRLLTPDSSLLTSGLRGHPA